MQEGHSHYSTPDDGSASSATSDSQFSISPNRHGLCRTVYAQKRTHPASCAHKGVCLCLCVLCTKAAHIELVSDLTSEAFLTALRQFVSHRGLPSELFSDNGSNFVGAHNTLKDLYSYLSQPSIQQSLSSFASTHHITWHYSSERAPHFGEGGGLWESL